MLVLGGKPWMEGLVDSVSVVFAFVVYVAFRMWQNLRQGNIELDGRKELQREGVRSRRTTPLDF